MGKAHDFDDVEEYQRETAFTDLYGDFEDLVQARRDQIPTNSATILRVARAQSITDYTDTASRAVTKYTIAPGKNVKQEDIPRFTKADANIEKLGQKLKIKGVKETDYDWTDYALDVQAQGFIEEFYKD